jgi:putative SOS response-associated peptidase YedK
MSYQFLAFAGLHEVWTMPDGKALYTFTIITKEADAFMSHLHHRMPVILERALEEVWLGQGITSIRAVLNILERSAGTTLDAYPVSRMVNKPSVDSQALIQPVA